MKIAVTYDNGQVFQHFGHTEQFKLYDVEDNKVTGTEILDSGDFGHESLIVLLQQKGVERLLCGGIGGGAQNALAQAGIKLFGGVTGSADEAVKAYLAGTLEYTANATCNHHAHQHSCG